MMDFGQQRDSQVLMKPRPTLPGQSDTPVPPTKPGWASGHLHWIYQDDVQVMYYGHQRDSREMCDYTDLSVFVVAAGLRLVCPDICTVNISSLLFTGQTYPDKDVPDCRCAAVRKYSSRYPISGKLRSLRYDSHVEVEPLHAPPACVARSVEGLNGIRSSFTGNQLKLLPRAWMCTSSFSCYLRAMPSSETDTGNTWVAFSYRSFTNSVMNWRCPYVLIYHLFLLMRNLFFQPI